jgi:hypothetical protein
MAAEWVDDFLKFKTYVDQYLGPKPSPKHSIGRIENHGNYEVGNLKWSTQSEQQHSSRRSRIEKALATVLAR